MPENGPKECYNRYCGKVLGKEDESMFGKFPLFTDYYLCSACWEKFDGQKMRGRPRSIGLTHEEQVRLTAELDQVMDGKAAYNLGHPADEPRYTESVAEWVGWQRPVDE